MPQMTDYDVVVVGSGPAGATTARIAAQRGLRALLVDKKQELGVPIQCAGAVSTHALHDAGVPPNDEIISTSIFGFITYDAQGNAVTLDYRALKPDKYHDTPLGYVVDRRRFDRYLMTLAEQEGAVAWLKTEALGYAPHADGTAEVHLKRFDQSITVRTCVIVGADGLQSQVGKWANIRTHVKLSELASCLQLVVDHVETNGLLEIVTGHEWAPGGYAWVFPKGYGYAEVGLGVVHTMTDKNARWHLDHFMQNSFMADRLKDCRILKVQGGGVPLAAPLEKPYADHIILVGDAARHVNPITGGGIHMALRGGVIAGNFLGDFLATGKRPTAANLAGYQQRWFDELGHALYKLYTTKTDIFGEKNIPRRDQMLYKVLSGYFHPSSEFRKV
jgi:digeranylgeranylglycerophospholipid reductase